MRISDWSSDVCSSDLLAAIAEARSLHCCNLQAAAQLVDHQGRKRFAFNVFSNDEERTARLNDGFQNGEHRLQVRQLLLVDQDVGIVQFDLHLFRVGDEIGRKVRSEEHTSELQSLMRISYADFC